MAVHRSPEERRALTLDWLASDLTAGEFADWHGVSTSSLYRWRRELDGDADEPVDFVELVAAPETPAASDADPVPVELQLEGAAVLVRPGVDAETLATVLSALRSAP